MKRYTITVVVLAILAAAVYAPETAEAEEVRTDRWACWLTPRDFNFAREAGRTAGDTTLACRPTTEAGTVVEFWSDGTGYILRGYRPGGVAPRGEPDRDRGAVGRVTPYTPFNVNRVADIRWQFEHGRLRIATESRDDGAVTHRAWDLKEAPSENVMQFRSSADFNAVITLWRIGSPEHEALKAWRRCVEGNKDRGLDMKPCTDPLTGVEASGWWNRAGEASQ